MQAVRRTHPRRGTELVEGSDTEIKGEAVSDDEKVAILRSHSNPSDQEEDIEAKPARAVEKHTLQLSVQG